MTDHLRSFLDDFQIGTGQPLEPDPGNYPRLQPGDPSHREVMGMRLLGVWMCDSIDHNEDTGCSNPSCFKFQKENGQ